MVRVNRNKRLRRLLAVVLTAAVYFSCVPAVSFAEELGLPDGQYVIWNPAYGKALSSVYDGYYNRAVSVTETDGTLTGYGDTEIWTVTNQADGTITISCAGGALSLGDKHNDMPLGDVNSCWKLEPLGDGNYRVINSLRGNWIRYSAHENWDTTSNGQEGDRLILKFTALSQPEPEATTETTQETTEETMEETSEETTETSSPEPQRLSIGDGDYVIWNPAYGKALSSEYDGFYPRAVTVSETAGTLGGYEATEIWTVTNQPDGTVTLSCPGGSLSMGDTYDDISLDQAHDTWELWDLGDGTCQVVNSVRGNFLRYSAFENWDTTAEPEGARLILRFTPAEQTTETTEETTGEITPPSEPEETQPVENNQVTKAYNLYFGQLHSHTDISDGLGTVEEAFQYGSAVEGLDFLAVTDHSNSFDNADNGVLSDGSILSEDWLRGHAAAEAVTDGEFVGLYGFEMTWNNGLGHINTFNTPGWQSRSQDAYKKATTALKNYYETLQTVPGSISQFNHPGEDYGDFLDFAYSEAADAVMKLIEVGSGEGAFGTGEYAPAYDAYVRALDKGWHLAPTNSQNNHAGQWGDWDAGRTVVLADALTEAGIYDAMANYRVYATEDSDLEIYYTLNGSVMGSIVDVSNVSRTVELCLELCDPTDSGLGKVEVITENGVCLASRTVTASRETLRFTLDSGYPYYFIRITQPDGDIAVTAPVWVETVEIVGISDFRAEDEVIVAGEPQAFALELVNQGSVDFTVTSVTFGVDGVEYNATLGHVPAGGKAACGFTHTFSADGIYTVTATVRGTLGDVEMTFTEELAVTVLPATITGHVVIDGTHGGGSGYDNIITIAAAQGIRVHVETETVTAAGLAECRLLVIPAPEMELEAEFIQTVADFVAAGGNLILCGAADSVAPEAADRVNSLLAALGSTMSLSDDTVYDPATNGGTPTQLVTTGYNTDARWNKGIREGQAYRQEGCSVNVGSGIPLVKGLSTTFSTDGDGDGQALNGETYTAITLDDSDGEKKREYDLVKSAGEVCLLACEELGGTVFLAGGDFISNGLVQAEMDNIWDLPYANRTIFENILGMTRTKPQVTPIGQVRQAADGEIFLILGRVTAGTYNPNNTFTDSIYIQDDTGGILLTPYDTHGLELGMEIRATGSLETVNGEKVFNLLSIEISDRTNVLVTPQAKRLDYEQFGGQLLVVSGEVSAAALTADGIGVSRFTVMDEGGNLAVVFIEDYIFSGSTGKNELSSVVKLGNKVSAIGLLYQHPTLGTVLRVRDCDEVQLLWAVPAETEPTETTAPVEPETTAATEAETTAPAETTRPNTGKNPATGDGFPLLLNVVTMLASLLALAVLRKKSR